MGVSIGAVIPNFQTCSNLLVFFSHNENTASFNNLFLKFLSTCKNLHQYMGQNGSEVSPIFRSYHSIYPINRRKHIGPDLA
jgi:hypothetical protein